MPRCTCSAHAPRRAQSRNPQARSVTGGAAQGVWERDEWRGNDSFEAFAEVLDAAKRYNSDLVLLGGDLFHDNKPSRSTVIKCLDILNRSCIGDRPVAFQVRSLRASATCVAVPVQRPLKLQRMKYCLGEVCGLCCCGRSCLVRAHARTHHGAPVRCAFTQVLSSPGLIESGVDQTQDPHLNVGLPVFTIHGNHDDPSGPENLSAVDVLSTVHYVNYFGKHTFGKDEAGDTGKIRLSPLLLQKARPCVPAGSARALVCTPNKAGPGSTIIDSIAVPHVRSGACAHARE